MGGDIVFNESFDDNCLVNVVSLAFQKRPDYQVQSPKNAARRTTMLSHRKANGFLRPWGVTFASVGLKEEKRKLIAEPSRFPTPS